ncbi:N-acetyl-gamma-glutamyl-phosphate reductase, partial [bacterium]
YGLPELGDREEIASARLVANPGCHVTAAALALTPLVRAGIVTGIPVVDSKSGVSGAGRARKETDYLFSELDNGLKAYAVTGHRHTPELEQVAGVMVRFTPHLVPMTRGIHATIHVPVSATSADEVRGLLRDAYQGEPFVRVVNSPPTTKQVLGTNRCDLWADYDPRTGHAVLLSVIDNLGKGASHQAIQSMNLMIGAPETTGLPVDAVWP